MPLVRAFSREFTKYRDDDDDDDEEESRVAMTANLLAVNCDEIASGWEAWRIRVILGDNRVIDEIRSEQQPASKQTVRYLSYSIKDIRN